MFKNRAFQVKMVDTKNDADNQVAEVKIVKPEEIAQIATDLAIKTIGALGIVIAANRVLNTACQIAVIAAKAKLK